MEKLEKLSNDSHSQLLDVVDRLRLQRVSDLLPLPQLIVCGDQSSGKSSVLEAISGVPFPRRDGLCTRFATEVILRRSSEGNETSISVSINPGPDRTDSERAGLRRFSKTLSDVKELPSVIQDVKETIKIASFSDDSFTDDVLRLEISGPKMPQLTIVDLPGLIHSETKKQTAQDVELVSKLVQSYMDQKRSIILAVVSAKNDYANQIVLKRARATDPYGQRTLGIITKPDTLHSGSEGEASFINLAQNKDVTFKLGWHVLRNADSNDGDEVKAEEPRDLIEERFFHRSNWRSLDESMLGIASLRDRLSRVLFDQIRKELPHLMGEIDACMVKYQGELNRLGRQRESEEEQRHFIVELCQKAYDLCRAGRDGNYDHEFFGRIGLGVEQPSQIDRRLRAVVQNSSADFAQKLRDEGSRWTISAETDTSKGILSRTDAIQRIVKLLRASRGREPFGTYNPLLITEVFQEYASPWPDLAKAYVHQVWRQAVNFLEAIVQELTDESVSVPFIRRLVTPHTDMIFAKAEEALRACLQSLDSHITSYNKDFFNKATAQRHHLHRDRVVQHLTERLKGNLRSGTSVDATNLADGLLCWPAVDGDRYAAEEILAYSQAYYEIACERLVDTLPTMVVESAIMMNLTRVFEPVSAMKLSADIVRAIGGEHPSKVQLRRDLQSKMEILRASAIICKRHAGHVVRTPASSVDDFGFGVQARSDDDSATSVVSETAAPDLPDVTPTNEPIPEVAEADYFGGYYGNGKKKKKKSAAAQPVARESVDEMWSP